jgi:hypothetical protein
MKMMIIIIIIRVAADSLCPSVQTIINLYVLNPVLLCT